MATFGENIRRIRLERGYNQLQFAELLGSNQSVVSAWERGYRNPPLETVQDVADILHVPVSSLITMDEVTSDEGLVREITDLVRRDDRIRMIFTKLRYMASQNVDVVLGVVNAISRNSHE